MWICAERTVCECDVVLAHCWCKTKAANGNFYAAPLVSPFPLDCSAPLFPIRLHARPTIAVVGVLLFVAWWPSTWLHSCANVRVPQIYRNNTFRLITRNEFLFHIHFCPPPPLPLPLSPILRPTDGLSFHFAHCAFASIVVLKVTPASFISLKQLFSSQ